MKFNEEKKKSIIFYLLEKIDQEGSQITKSVSETFSINQNTIYTYIHELEQQNIIRKVKRGQYELINTELHYNLSRSNGDLDSDTYAYEQYLAKRIQKYGSNVQQIWSYVFSEMINNVMDHSLAEDVHLIIKQDYLNTSVLIADNGIGIFKKIKEHFGFATLDEAICELFKGKLTTDSANHSGEGIFFSSKMMDEFFILSSKKIFTTNKSENSKIIDMADSQADGTGVIMRLSNFTHKTPQDVFDLYANVDGGFVKTRIPLKNIFDTTPVSRSQAKRICNRLEKFKEVILDCDGLPWMGQGFAHQLFVVFASAHPDIELIPINMNEDITKMLHHVTCKN